MVRVERRDDVGRGVVVVTLDRPERRNAIDHETLLELLDAQHASADARAVVLTGAPPAFCAGADLHGVRQEVFSADLRRVLDGFVAIRGPVIAAVDGPALGAGAQLVAFSDLRVATPDSPVGVPAAKLGLVVEQATIARFTREFGASITRAMLVGAETFTAEHLHAAGAVHRLCGLDAALDWAAKVAALAPLSVAGHKLAVEATAVTVDDDPDVAAARAAAWASEDAAEGRSAFLEKRRPVFRGR